MIMNSSGHIATETAHDHGVALVDPHARGVKLITHAQFERRARVHARIDHAPIEGMLGGAECVRDLYQLAVAGACALADGAVAGALALTRDHVATREQFGRPLAAFQAVSQQIADVYIASRTHAPGHPVGVLAAGRGPATRPPPSTWRDTGARSKPPGPFGYVIICTAGSGWT